MAKNKLTAQTSEKNMPNSAVKEADQELKWRAESALRDLTRAEEHKADPQLMKHVDRMREAEMAKLERVKKITVQSNEKTKKK